MDISDTNDAKDYGEVNIHEMLDVLEENINSDDLDNQSNHQWKGAHNSGESEDKYQDMEETLPPESQFDTDSIIEDMYNKLEIE